jgi:hypothetical protein
MSDTSGDGHGTGTVSSVQRSLGDLFGELSQEFTNLIHRELEVAKDELRGDAAGRSGSLPLLAMGLAAGLCVAFVGVGLAWGLAELMPIGWAFTLVGLAFGVGAFVLHQRSQRVGEDDTALPAGPVHDRF